MCHSEPTIYGMTLRIADEIGRKDAPSCCGDEMRRGRTAHDELTFTCRCCGVVIEVDDIGLVFDIRAKAGA